MDPSNVLDPTTDEFREAGHRLIDWIADHFERIDEIPVMARVEPGEIAAQFRGDAPEKGRRYAELMREFDTKILPGVTHWNHPGFFAYFAITGSQAGILGELLSAALNVNGMLWKSCPAATELERVVLEWLRRALGLPEGWFGIINDTASMNSYLALAAAREALGFDIRSEGMTGRDLPPLRIYCSDQAHSSIEKAGLALGFGARGVIKIPTDAAFAMRADALEEAIARDRKEGALPCAVVATTGTTATTSADPIAAIAAIAKRETIWLHVDGAYAGSAMICPELRHLWSGIENADSVVVNPHKWLFTPVDCSVLYTRRPDDLKKTFSLIPEYLKTTDAADVNYMDYGLQLGRRFRALKLWLVFEHYGLERLRAAQRGHIELAHRLADALRERDDVQVVAPQTLSVVVFRRVVRDASGREDEPASEKASTELVERINASGRAFLATTRLKGTFAIRVAIGNGMTEWRHVEEILLFLDGKRTAAGDPYAGTE
ncbi:MAG TPA: pyridoxal-dependent decarboxylase [Thermoanaerobaculia bacterium]|nr:pyridoxal-dependent decarboxylase [Thermoanaerobaculia bacterium]